jgi:hypothetical protein
MPAERPGWTVIRIGVLGIQAVRVAKGRVTRNNELVHNAAPRSLEGTSA